MAKVKFTQHQQDAIDAQGSGILVSAAAGSGKTAVLTQRVIRLLTGDNPINADRLIIVTFTVLAADEMRQRISSKLSELIEDNPNDKALQNQQLLLANAKICTIHSLCSSLIRENFQKLGLNGDFRIADETEIEIIKNDAVDEVFEQFYAEEDSGFLSLVEFTCTKDDKKLVELVLSIYDFIRSFAFPKSFLKSSGEMYNHIIQNNLTISDSRWHQSLSLHIEEALLSCVNILNGALKQIETDEKVKANYFESFNFDKTQILDIIDALKNKSWNDAVLLAKSINKLSLKAIRGYEDKEFLQSLQEKRKTVYKTIDNILKRYLICTQEEFIEDIEILSPILNSLFSAVTEIYDVIEEKKQEQGIIDYADLEHYAVKLLVDHTDDGQYSKTEIAETLSDFYAEIMIDECQDINEVQNLIFTVLSKNEENLFMVGDVKQSIYRFRKAMPKLFIDKKFKSLPYDRNGSSKHNSLITLENNFRSRTQVCDTVNLIFSQIMSNDMGEIEYNESEKLINTAKFDEYDNAFSEIHVIDYNNENDIEKSAVEAEYIGNIIKNMIQNKYMVQGDNGLRPCRYRDFAILLRAKKGKADIFKNKLKEMNVSCFSDSVEGYFTEYEISVILNLLRIIDNPLLDIPLLSVLMSPMFNFSADDVTKIRLTKQNQPLYIAVLACVDLVDIQCIEFISSLTKLRQKAVTVRVDELLQEIYDQTDFVSLVYAMENGEQRDANLRLLLSYSKQYENIGANGLSGFLRYIDRIIANKQDFSSANIISPNADTVKIMSVHSSKGLEFPICIVADCAKKFNKMDLNKGYQLNSQLGFGIKITKPSELKSYTNIPYEAIRLQSEKEALSEEMRVLYVALTRAKEKLIMTMTIPKATEKLRQIASSLEAEYKLPAYDVYSGASYADWILSAALRHPSLYDIRKEIGADGIPLISSDFKIKCFLSQSSENSKNENIFNTVEPAPIDYDKAEQLETIFSYQYPYKDLTIIPAKLTATQIAKQTLSDSIKLDDNPPFMQKQGITPAQRGTFLHSFMQFADYENGCRDLDAEIKRLVKQQFLTQEQADALNLPKITAFFNSKLYMRMKVADKVIREYKFLHFIKAGEIYFELNPPFSDEEILIQGIADCILIEDNEVTVIDYKTDYTKDPNVLIERYKGQLKTYKNAVSQAFSLPVKECLIYSLHLEREIVVETD